MNREDQQGRAANTQLRAYAIWESEGRPDGRQAQSWDQADRELYAASPDSFAPGSRGITPNAEMPNGQGQPFRKSAPTPRAPKAR